MQSLEKVDKASELDIELKFDNLDPVEEVLQRMRAADIKEFQDKYIAEVLRYMEEGHMPRRVWDKLPKALRVQYQRKFMGMSGHVRGVPMTATQKTAYAKSRNKAKLAKASAKQARKGNRSNRK